MLTLAWANLMHSRLRSLLSVAAVGIGIALMLVSRGLADGSIAEVAQRVQSVDAELVVLPAQDNIIFSGGAVFPHIYENYLRRQHDARGPLAAEVIPAFFGQVRMGGQQQRLFGVDPLQMHRFLGPRRVLEGRAFDRAVDVARRIEELRSQTGQRNVAGLLTPAELEAGYELVIDERLRRVGQYDPRLGRRRPYELGDVVQVMGKPFRIVGVVEAGVAGRVFAPLETLRTLLNGGESQSSMFFIRLRPGLDATEAAEVLARAVGADARVELKSDYGRLLRDSFAPVNAYMNASSGLALVVCFLFILLTLYTAVVERTREIGILKSLGVSRLGLVRLAVCEALLISLAGVATGILLAFGARAVMQQILPLLTVELPPRQMALAAAVGAIGGGLSALYPGYRAARLDPATALSHE